MKNSAQNFGLILILCGSVGLYEYLDGGEPPSSAGGGYMGVFNLVAYIFHSLLVPSAGALVTGVLILVSVYLYNKLKKPS